MSMTVPRGQGTALYIGGEWVDASGDDALAVVNPATEEVIAQVPQASWPTSIARSRPRAAPLDAGPWPRMSPRERSDVLLRFVADGRAIGARSSST